MSETIDSKIKSRQWHFIIPFFNGINRNAGPKGGAPIEKKVEYLRSTLESIVSHFENPDIHIFVRDDASEQTARIFPVIVHRIECPAKELPYRMLVEVSKFKYDFKRDDMLCFIEDDQILKMSASVKTDIENSNKDYLFAPHRWSRLFMGFKVMGRVRYLFDNIPGVLDNIDHKSAQPEILAWEHKWEVQDTLLGAYAGCWMMKYSTFRKIDLRLKQQPDSWLEMGSHAVFDKFPVLKLALHNGEEPSSFIVNHLSGFDRNKRIFF